MKTYIWVLYLVFYFLVSHWISGSLLALSPLAYAEDSKLDLSEYDISSQLKIIVYGYPELKEKKYKVENFNPLQSENLSLITPGLTVAKLGSMGQKTSLRYNSYTTGDLTFLFDGFEISDPSDPSEGFEVSSFLLMPNFDLKISSTESMGVFSRQLGGVISIEPFTSEDSYVRSAFGSENQGLVSVQKNFCKDRQCLSLSGGGTYVNAQSASTHSRVPPSGSPSTLESDAVGLGYLSLGYQKQLGSTRMLKVRAHSQYSKTDIDDYNENFIYKDDPNARLQSSNHFLGLSLISDSSQLFFENTFLNRLLKNEWDEHSATVRDESYTVFRSKLRGSHHLVPSRIKGLDFYWYAQSLNLNTKKIADDLSSVLSSSLMSDTKNLSRVEAGFQIDKKSLFENTELITSVNFNELSGFGSGYGVSQSVQRPLLNAESSNTQLLTYFGFKERRPSFFQLFDPQFGNLNLDPEQLFFLRPKLKTVFIDTALMKHNISLEYFYESLNSRVVYLASPQPGYGNSGRIRSNSFVFDYQLELSNFTTRAFYRKSLDSEQILKSLPWSTSEEIGFGGSFQSKIGGRIWALSTDIKWLMGMFSPSQKQIGNLVQSQANLSFQIDANDRINLQLNNIFNDKKIWDEGFRRQSFSWMVALTKTI